MLLNADDPTQSAAGLSDDEPTPLSVDRAAALRTISLRDASTGAAAAETGPVKKPFSSTPASGTRNIPNVSVLSVMRTLDLGSLRLKILAFTLLSLIGALSQAVILLVISEVLVAGVEGRHSIHPPFGPSFTSTSAMIVALVALVLFFCYQASWAPCSARLCQKRR